MILYENLIRRLTVPAMVLVALHDNTVLNAIDGASCYVDQRYHSLAKEWRPPKEASTVRQMIDKFLKHHEIDMDNS